MAKNDSRSSDVNLKYLVRGHDEWNHALQFASRNKVNMSSIEALKSEALALQEKEKALGHVLKHCDALEQVAKKHGYDNWRACLAILSAAPPPEDKTQMNIPQMKHYESSEWNFALDIPKRWNSFPPVPTNDRSEVIRFSSLEDGFRHLLIVVRWPHDPQKPLRVASDWVQQILAKDGFGNFSTAETTVGSRVALLLESSKLRDDGTLSCRHYFITEDTLGYTLAFFTNNKAGMFELYDRMAQSFEILAESPSLSPASGP